MSTKFFIGGNKFYDSEEEANADLALFEVEHKIPHGTFEIVMIHKDDEEAFPASATVH
jgi:hypothetical protein